MEPTDGDAQSQVCYRHTERPAGVRCARCDNPICPDCMTDAPVGFQCPSCIAEGARSTRSARRAVARSRRPEWVVSPLIVAIVVVDVAAFVASELDHSLVVRFSNSRAGLDSGEYYRLFTSAFLQGGWLHLLLNTSALLILGPELEALVGRWRAGGIFVVSVLGSSTLSYLVGPSGSVGASGGLFGVVGALFTISYLRRLRTRYTLTYIALSLAVASVLLPNVDNVGHVGGVVTGAAIGAALEITSRHRSLFKASMLLCAVAVALVSVVVFQSRRAQEEAKWHFAYETDFPVTVDRLTEMGVPYENLLGQMVLLPTYQVTTGAPARFKVVILRDPDAPRRITLDFGDGGTSTVTVAAGGGVAVEEFRHRFSRVPARHTTTMYVDGKAAGDPLGTAVVDACGQGDSGPGPAAPPQPCTG